jgi:branched-chain amino acid transport system substrate-binding protein
MKVFPARVMKWRYFAFACVIFALLAGFGCAQKQEAAPSPAAPKEIVIGFNGPLSGPAAYYGVDCVSGIDMAISEINEAGGVTIKGQKYVFKLEKADHKADPTQAVNNARRLREQFGARFIFDPVWNCISPQLGINQEKGNEFLMMAYTSTPASDQTGNRLVISIPPPFTTYIPAMAELAKKEGWQKIAMLVTAGAYGDEWREAFKHYWESQGGTITADQPANYYVQTDFSAPLTAVLATKPDALLIGGPSAPTGLVIEQARSLGFKGGFILVDQAKMDYIVDVVFKGDFKNMENVMGVPAVAGVPLPMAKSFDQKFTQKYNIHNTWEAIHNYCAMFALARAIEAAGTAEDVYAVREAFPKAYPLSGDKFPQQYYGVNERGRILSSAGIQVIKGGKYEKRKDNVWWAKTKEDFDKVVQASNLADKNETLFWAPLKDYAQ